MDPSQTADQPANSAPRSRRSLLTAAVAAGGALATQALVRPLPVAAADVVLGGVNTAPAATTIRTTEATATAKALVGHVLTTVAGPSTAGVQGLSNATNGNGVFGYAPAGNSKGVWGRSAAGTGVYGDATATTGTNYGVRGTTLSSGGVGVHGANTAANGTGIRGVANTGGNAKGVHGQSTSGAGVVGEGATGVRGTSTAGGTGVLAQGGSIGLRAEATSFGGAGVYALAPNGPAINFGVRGIANSVAGLGVRGENTATNGTGVYGIAPNGTGSRGVIARSDAGVGAEAIGGTHGVHATGATGVQGEGTTGNGVYGHTTAIGASGVYGESFPGPGNASYGVAGRAVVFGLWGEASGNGGRGVFGSARGASGVGVYGFTDGGGSAHAGYFEGDVTVTGTFTAPMSFMQWDHPDAPAQRWYRQAPVGSFEQVSVMSGNVVTAPSGRAAVRVPAIFARYHKDVRYQLTLIGQRGAAWVADELDARGRFVIATDVPNARVSWQLTAARTDPAAVRQPLRVESLKPRRQRGRYLQPDLYGEPRKQGLVAPEGQLEGPKAPRRPRPSGVSRARDQGSARRSR